MKRFKYINTLDIDHYHPAYPYINVILQKIKRLDCCVALMYRVSSSLNGYHVKIFCKKFGCDLCRLTYDDQTRFTADLTNREWYERNVLFNVKSYHKAGKTIILTPTRWIIVKQFPRSKPYKHPSNHETILKILRKLEPLSFTLLFYASHVLSIKNLNDLLLFTINIFITYTFIRLRSLRYGV